MIFGFNTDIRHEDTVYHVQSEAREAEQLRSRVATLSRRRRGAESTADVLVGLLVGEANGLRVTEQLISRYERYIACARQPGLRDIERRILQQRTDAVVRATAPERPHRVRMARNLMDFMAVPNLS